MKRTLCNEVGIKLLKKVVDGDDDVEEMKGEQRK